MAETTEKFKLINKVFDSISGKTNKDYLIKWYFLLIFNLVNKMIDLSFGIFIKIGACMAS